MRLIWSFRKQRLQILHETTFKKYEFQVFCRVDFIVYTRYFLINYKKVDFYFFLMYYIYIKQDWGDTGVEEEIHIEKNSVVYRGELYEI